MKQSPAFQSIILPQHNCIFRETEAKEDEQTANNRWSCGGSLPELGDFFSFLKDNCFMPVGYFCYQKEINALGILIMD